MGLEWVLPAACGEPMPEQRISVRRKGWQRDTTVY